MTLIALVRGQRGVRQVENAVTLEARPESGLTGVNGRRRTSATRGGRGAAGGRCDNRRRASIHGPRHRDRRRRRCRACRRGRQRAARAAHGAHRAPGAGAPRRCRGAIRCAHLRHRAGVDRAAGAVEGLAGRRSGASPGGDADAGVRRRRQRTPLRRLSGLVAATGHHRRRGRIAAGADDGGGVRRRVAAHRGAVRHLVDAGRQGRARAGRRPVRRGPAGRCRRRRALGGPGGGGHFGAGAVVRTDGGRRQFLLLAAASGRGLPVVRPGRGRDRTAAAARRAGVAGVVRADRAGAVRRRTSVRCGPSVPLTRFRSGG